MPTVYTCSTCCKEFKLKASFDRHAARKVKCKPDKLAKAFLATNPVIQEVVDTSGAFSENSLKMNKKLTREVRHSEGIFFTPKNARQLLFEQMDVLGVKPTSILEPSFGSGEFLADIRKKYPCKDVVGVEKNTELFNSLKADGQTLVNADFLQYNREERFDLIVGNPPYFVFKDKYPKCMSGRPNIYVAFLYKCLDEHLKDDGHLGFVLPTSLFNCSYYEPMRKYIYENCSVLYVKELNVDYYQTQQDTMVIIIQKKADAEHRYMFNRGGAHYISPSYKELYEGCKDTATLSDLGFKVCTGTLVWNQEKENLDSNEGTLLIYSSNIVNNSLVLNNIKNEEKKQYVKKDFKKKPMSGPAILVNRGYGNIYAFNYILVEGIQFYAENHVNMIVPLTEDAKAKIPLVMKSLADKRTGKFVKEFVGNGALSATELQNVLPIYINDA